jgi:hypothetical protein
MYFPQDLLFNCDKYDELRKTLFHKIKSLLCPNVNWKCKNYLIMEHDLAKDPVSPKLLGI